MLSYGGVSLKDFLSVKSQGGVGGVMAATDLFQRLKHRATARVLLKSLSICLSVCSFTPNCVAQSTENLIGIRLPATRIISLAPNITEVLQVIGAQDQVVGYSFFCSKQIAFPPRPIVGSFNQPDIDAVQTARPDVVLFSEHARGEDLAKLDAAGLRYLVLPATNISDIVRNIKILGDLTGRVSKANEIATRIEQVVGDARTQLTKNSTSKRPSVFLEVDGPSPLYTAGKGSFISETIHLAGGRNIFAERPDSYLIVTSEEVVKADPDYIFVGGLVTSPEDVRNRPGWDKIAAVKNGKVFCGAWSADDLWLLLWRPGHSVDRTIQGLTKLFGMPSQ